MKLKQSDKGIKRTVDDTAFAKSSSKKSTSKTYGMIDHEIKMVVKGLSKNRNAKSAAAKTCFFPLFRDKNKYTTICIY